jgi:hypothetical protein
MEVREGGSPGDRRECAAAGRPLALPVRPGILFVSVLVLPQGECSFCCALCIDAAELVRQREGQRRLSR